MYRQEKHSVLETMEGEIIRDVRNLGIKGLKENEK